jgi:hypothetical protein
MKKIIYFVAFCMLLILCFKEKSGNQTKYSYPEDSYCKAPFKYNYGNKLPSYNSDSIINANKELRDKFSDQSILILNALIIWMKFIKSWSLKEILSVSGKSFTAKIKINSKITIALTELDAVAAEFDCEGERVAQIGNYVDNLNDSRNNKLILLSIVTGAAASVAGGIVK